MAAKAKKRQKSNLIWGTVDSSGWPKNFWNQMDKADVEIERTRRNQIMEQKANAISPAEAVQKLPWLMVRKECHDATARSGYRVTKCTQAITKSGETISGVEYEKREAKETYAELAEANQSIDSALSTPEMLLVGKQRQFLSELKANQEVSDIVAGQIRLQLRTITVRTTAGLAQADSSGMIGMNH